MATPALPFPNGFIWPCDILNFISVCPCLQVLVIDIRIHFGFNSVMFYEERVLQPNHSDAFVVWQCIIMAAISVPIPVSRQNLRLWKPGMFFHRGL